MELRIITSRTRDREIVLGRINVFLGANGTGKSKLLAELRGRIGEYLPGYNPLNIEGGRALQMFDSLEVNHQNFGNYRTFEQTITGYRSKRQGTLQSRLFDALKSLEQLAEKSKIEHSDAVTDWINAHASQPTANTDSLPRRQIDPMTRVFETFSDIFPSIQLSYSAESRRLTCMKNGNQYGPTGLSDGEKQVFSILVDVIELTDTNSVLFVDEPELNLNPGLANRLWSSIESLLPNAVFIYATHSVNFALRPSVEHLLVLSNSDENIHEMENLSELTPRDKEELLGNIPSLVANKKTLVVEGKDESFDNIFYNWILGDRDISPSAVGSSEDVVAISKRSGKWSRISPNVALSGIVDRDYKSDTAVEHIRETGVLVLDFHEAESYLCTPVVLTSVANALGTVSPLPTEEDFVGEIARFVSANELKIAARRAAAQLNQRIGVSVPAKVLARITSTEQLKQVLLADVREQRARVGTQYDEASVGSLIDSEISRIGLSVHNRDVSAMLVLAPGKELLAKLAPKVGCVDPNAVARAARHHLSLDSFPNLRALAERISAGFETGASQSSLAPSCLAGSETSAP